MFTMEQERDVKRMLFNNKDKTEDLGRKRMAGERAGKAKVADLSRDLGLGVGKGLEKLIRVSSGSTQHRAHNWCPGSNSSRCFPGRRMVG